MKRHWFKAKDYGWGWQPSTWQGWLILIAWLGANAYWFYRFDLPARSQDDVLFVFLPTFLLSVGALLLVTKLTGDKPTWRWAGKTVGPAEVWRQMGVLLLSLVIPLAIGFAGSFAVSPAIDGGWYQALALPAWNPPAWVFGPVWTILYLLLGGAAYIVWYNRRKSKEGAESALRLYALNLVLNGIWTPLFFGAHLIGLALLDIAMLVVCTGFLIRAFAKVSEPAALMLVPYILWLLYALSLNLGISLLN